MPAQAEAERPHTVPKSVAWSSADRVVAGTQAEAATMFSQMVALGVGGRVSEASQEEAETAGQSRGLLVAV